MTTPANLAEVLPLALGHDQTASSCPWVQLTRSTTDYPSRIAQAALAFLSGALPATEELVDLMYRCDGCCRCQAPARELTNLIFEARALLAGQGLVEIADQAEVNFRQFGNIYGDLSDAKANFETSKQRSSTLFVPGAATLFHDPKASRAAWRLVQHCSVAAEVNEDVLDSGFVLRELGLRAHFDFERMRVRDSILQSGYELVIAATPKDAFGLSTVLDGLPVSVKTVSSVVTTSIRDGHINPRSPGISDKFAFHPSEYLRCNVNELELIERELSRWLGNAYRQESNGQAEIWPAAVERPSTMTNQQLARQFADARTEQLLERANCGNLTVLTVDPFSRAALTRSLAGRATVVDLMRFVERHIEGDFPGA